MNWFTGFAHKSASRIKVDISDLNYFVRIGLGCGRTPYRSADAGRQLPNMKWLGDVIIRAGIERCHFVILAFAHSQHQDRQSGQALPHVATGLNPSHAWHVDVQEHDIILGLVDKLQSGLTRGCIVHDESHRLERVV
jgi:hypothetical protein